MKTTGTCPDRSAWQVRWAAECLGLEAQASPEAARRALLRELPAAEFVPPPAWRRAFQVLQRQEPSPADSAGLDEYLHDRAGELRQEVESFAERYWELAPAERRTRWQELIAGCGAFPQLGARLQLLEPGLDMAPISVPPENWRVGELVQAIQRLFVLRPGPRAQKRQAFRFRCNMDADVRGWEAAALMVKDHYPAVAALQTTLVDEMASTAAWATLVLEDKDGTASTAVWTTWQFSGPGSQLTLLDELATWGEQHQHLAKMRRRLKAARPRQRQSDGNPLIGWLLAGFLIFGVKVLFNILGSTNSSDSWRRPSVDSRYQPSKDEQVLRELQEMVRKDQAGEATRRLLGEEPLKEKVTKDGAKEAKKQPSGDRPSATPTKDPDARDRQPPRKSP